MTAPDEPEKDSPIARSAERKTRHKSEKRHRKSKSVPETTERLDAEGRLRPQFLASFPDDPELSRLVSAFERGDYATVRKQAPELAERTTDARVREAALELRHRIDPDPLMKYLLAASVAFFVFLTLYQYLTH